jgi:hypothetical protein
MARSILSLLLFAAFTFGQTFEVKDRNGAPAITVSGVKMFRYSDYFGKEIPDFKAALKNVSGGRLLRVSITGIVHKKDGSLVKFNLGGDFQEDSIHDATYMFGQPTKFWPEDLDSVEFTLEKAERLTTKDGFHFKGFVAKDEGCLNDYLATKSLAGVALRKRLAELLEYECGFVVENAQEAHVLEETKKSFTLGKNKFSAVQIILWDEGIRLGLDPSPHFSDSGWVLLSTLVPGKVLITEQIGMTEEVNAYK